MHCPALEENADVFGFLQQRPMYQPSGESDKENKRLEVPQSPSSSDMSLSEQPPLLSRLERHKRTQTTHTVFFFVFQ